MSVDFVNYKLFYLSRYHSSQSIVTTVEYIEITAWLASAYDFNAQQVHNKNRTNEPTMQ